MTSNNATSVIPARMAETNELETPAHTFIATHDDTTLLATVPTGKDVARSYLEAAKDLNCSREVRTHFARCYNEQQADE